MLRRSASALTSAASVVACPAEREFFIDNLLVRIHFIIEMIWWTGLAPWEFEFPFPGSLTSSFLPARKGVSSGKTSSSALLTDCEHPKYSWCHGPRRARPALLIAKSRKRCSHMCLFRRPRSCTWRFASTLHIEICPVCHALWCAFYDFSKFAPQIIFHPKKHR